MTNDAELNKTMEQIFAYFAQLDKIPMTVITNYVKHKASPAKQSSEKPAPNFPDGFSDTCTHHGKTYEFPKWYGYDKNNHVKFALDKRSERSGWWKDKKETQGAFEELFDEMQKQNVVIEKTE